MNSLFAQGRPSPGSFPHPSGAGPRSRKAGASFLMKSRLPADFDADFYLEVYEDVRMTVGYSCRAALPHAWKGRAPVFFKSANWMSDVQDNRTQWRFRSGVTSEVCSMTRTSGEPVQATTFCFSYRAAESKLRHGILQNVLFFGDTFERRECLRFLLSAYNHKDWCYANAKEAATNA